MRYEKKGMPDVFLVLGYGAITAWSWITYQEGHLFEQVPVLLAMSPEQAFFFFPLFTALFLLILSRRPGAFTMASTARWMLLVGISSLLLFLPRGGTPWGKLADLVTLLVAAAGFSLFDASWLRLFTSLSPREAALLFAGANLAASLCAMVHFWPAPVALLLITALFPFVSALLWRHAAPSLIPDATQCAERSGGFAPFPRNLVFRFFFFYLACGFFHNQVLSSEGNTTSLLVSELLYGAGALAAALVIRCSEEADLRMIYKLAQFFIGVGFVLMIPFGSSQGAAAIIPIGFIQLGFGFFGTYSWTILAYLASRGRQENVLSVACKGLAIVAGSVFAGQGLILLLRCFFASSGIPRVQVFFMAGVLSLLMAGFFFHDNPETFAGYDIETEAPESPSPGSIVLSQEEEEEQQKALMVLQYGLTRQETRIALMLGEGLSNADMTERLNISQNTLRTHLKNLYKKVDVSGRDEAQELFSPLSQ